MQNTTDADFIVFSEEVVEMIVEDDVRNTLQANPVGIESKEESTGVNKAHAIELVALSIGDSDISTAVERDEGVVMNDDNMLLLMMMMMSLCIKINNYHNITNN